MSWFEPQTSKSQVGRPVTHTFGPRLGQTRVLLVWEYGCWKMPTGAVDAGEGMLAALRREVGEEVGCEVDARYAPYATQGLNPRLAGPTQSATHAFEPGLGQGLPGRLAIEPRL